MIRPARADLLTKSSGRRRFAACARRAAVLVPLLAGGCAGPGWRDAWAITGLPGKVAAVEAAPDRGRVLVICEGRDGGATTHALLAAPGVVWNGQSWRAPGALAAPVASDGAQRLLLLAAPEGESRRQTLEPWTTGDRPRAPAAPGDRAWRRAPLARAAWGGDHAGEVVVFREQVELWRPTGEPRVLPLSIRPEPRWERAAALSASADGKVAAWLLVGGVLVEVPAPAHATDAAQWRRLVLDEDAGAEAVALIAFAEGLLVCFAPDRGLAGFVVLVDPAAWAIRWRCDVGGFPDFLAPVRGGATPYVAFGVRGQVLAVGAGGTTRWEAAAAGRVGVADLRGDLWVIGDEQAVRLDGATGAAAARVALPCPPGSVRTAVLLDARVADAGARPARAGLLLGTEEWAPRPGGNELQLSGGLYFVPIDEGE